MKFLIYAKTVQALFLVNKSDLQQTLCMQEICNLSGKDVISFSAAKGDGLMNWNPILRDNLLNRK